MPQVYGKAASTRVPPQNRYGGVAKLTGRYFGPLDLDGLQSPQRPGDLGSGQPRNRERGSNWLRSRNQGAAA